MPISFEKYEKLAAEIRAKYDDVELALIALMARELYKGIFRPSWAAEQRANMRAVQRDIRRIVNEMSATRERLQRSFIGLAYGDGQTSFVSEAHSFGQLLDVQHATGVDFKAINILAELDSSMDAADRRILRSVDDAYADIVGRSAAEVASGTITYREAVRRELDDFADRGITSFVDRAGRSWEMQNYAEMATLTAIQRAAREGYIDAMQEFGYDLAQFSSHIGACPLCVAWEDVVVSVSGNTPDYPTLDDAIGSGMFHPRCLHDMHTYYEGYSTPRRVAPLEVEQPTEAYTARSKQRYYERQERRWKRRMAAAGTPEDERRAYAHVRQYQAAIRGLIADYNSATDESYDWLPRKYWREGGRAKMSDAARRLAPVIIR